MEQERWRVKQRWKLLGKKFREQSKGIVQREGEGRGAEGVSKCFLILHELSLCFQALLQMQMNAEVTQRTCYWLHHEQFWPKLEQGIERVLETHQEARRHQNMAIEIHTRKMALLIWLAFAAGRVDIVVLIPSAASWFFSALWSAVCCFGSFFQKKKKRIRQYQKWQQMECKAQGISQPPFSCRLPLNPTCI